MCWLLELRRLLTAGTGFSGDPPQGRGDWQAGGLVPGYSAVYTATAGPIQEAGPIMKESMHWQKNLQASVCGVITVSEYDRSFCLKHRILPPEKVAAVHNGILMSLHTVGTGYGNSLLIMVARLERPKTIALLKAWLCSSTWNGK